MILVTANKSRRLLHLSFIQRVTVDELRESEDEIRMLLADFPSGFTLLTDLERLESMDMDCAAEIGRTMELLKGNGIELVVRIIPDAKKDIGLNILSVFHYGRGLRTVTCENIAEAVQVLNAKTLRAR
jgi:hypothetical protein